MSPKDSKIPANRDMAEPSAVSEPVPVWMLLIFGALFYWAAMYFSFHGGGFDQHVYTPFATYADVDASNPKNPEEQARLMGADIFNKTCAACHQPTGMGKEGTAPPLNGSEWVQAPSPDRIVHAVLNGLTGQITVKGTEWNLTMPPWRDVYNDEQLAAVLTYVRSTWDNKAGRVKADTVAAARKEVHPGPMTSAELLQIPAQ